MLLNDGDEALLKVAAEPKSGYTWEEIHLKHLTTDDVGLKMHGQLPNLWILQGTKGT